MQELGLILIVAGALFYLGRRAYVSTSKKSDCSTGCGCEPAATKLKARSKS